MMTSKYRCRAVTSTITEDIIEYTSVDNDDDAECFGVYEVDSEGITDSWLADFKTRALAEQYIEMKETLGWDR